jgi:hypothetical protein
VDEYDVSKFRKLWYRSFRTVSGISVANCFVISFHFVKFFEFRLFGFNNAFDYFPSEVLEFDIQQLIFLFFQLILQCLVKIAKPIFRLKFCMEIFFQIKNIGIHYINFLI